ncbi:MAG: diaminopimelate epimerase [Xanthomonadales bacterium]|nr:diaminopimelate epimerase [Xanthomonadales bacterium]
MQGAGNDFVVVDARAGIAPDPELAVRLADRHYGVGCDQVMIVLSPREAGSVAAYAVVNADGSSARQCGNGARCVAAWLHRDGAFVDAAVLDGPSGAVAVRRSDQGEFELDLAVPDFEPAALPVLGARQAADGLHLNVADLELAFGAVAIGNPHVVIEVADVVDAPVDLAFALQAHPAFPEGCNVGFAQVLAPDLLRLRVIERGVGETLACGSGACAAHAWLRRSGRIGPDTRVELPGGTLGVRWNGEPGEPVRLRGPAVFVFEGELWP